MQHRLIAQIVILFLLTTCLSLALQNAEDRKLPENEQFKESNKLTHRSTRATRRPGFFRTLFSTLFEQWNDTRNTVGTVNQLINDNFLPENPPVTAAVILDPNVSTTTEPYRISRAEFAKILRKNLVGIQKLYEVELKDALQESEKYYKEFRKNASTEVSKFL